MIQDLKDIKDAKNVKRGFAVADGILPPHGGYKKLLSYQKAEIVFDATVKFCADLLDKYGRTVGQMVQAARSGKQNIVEASMASGTSKETELKLTGVARASMKELLEDYRDFLRKNGYSEWTPDHPYEKRFRELNRKPNANYDALRKAVQNPDPAIRANAILGLIKLTNYLLDQQIRRLEKDFLQDGGLREKMARARIEARKNRGPKAPNS